jgi:hypothetical protein
MPTKAPNSRNKSSTRLTPAKRTPRPRPTATRASRRNADAADAAEADRRLSDPAEKPILYAKARRQLELD